MKLLKRIKQKRCNNCIYAFKEGNIFACNKSRVYIEPLKLICIKKKED